MKKRYFAVLLLILISMLSSSFASAQVVERFPKPDFQTEYTRPLLQTPEPRSQALEYIDIFVLLGSLALASYLAHKNRSRKKLFIVMVFSLIYFGFYREGCVCSIGSIQNICLALFFSDYAIPVTVVIFFVIPLIFTLFFGRTFCAAVCPLGAIQDVVVLKPTKVPAWLNEVLSIFPYLYLGLAILFASTGAGFIICQYDPFVGFFRFGATFNMIVFGISILLLGTVIGRPYCRFLCPYGVLLNWMSRLSRWHVSITPSECINCRLCEESCPFDAINKPETILPEKKKSGIKRLGILFLLLPIVIIGSGWVVSRFHIPLSRQHFTVSLAEQIQKENSGLVAETTEETRTFRASGKPTEELMNEARTIQKTFKIGGWIVGGFLGFIFCMKLINLTIYKSRNDYVTDRGTCLSCARCFSYCPVELVRLGKMDPDEMLKMKSSN